MASDEEELNRRTNFRGGSRAEWHPDTVARLIESYGEKCASIKGYLKSKDWEDIVKYVNTQCEGSKIPKTTKQCREKIDSLKRRYKLEKRRAEIRGSENVQWSFFEKLDDIMKNLRRSSNVNESQSLEALDFEGFDKEKHYMEHEDVLLEDEFGLENDRRVGSGFFERGKRRFSSLGLGDRVDKGTCPSPEPNMDANTCSNTNPVSALTDALLNFSELYLKVESTKLELFERMNAELAKLNRRKRKKSLSSSVINCSDSPQFRASE
eukprot:TRINITY_DN30965_c0_g1_i1.p1 TRINITY_DN30965_c0_g1~~TRINITY_DN30965_c0_g1_i1.p1  ORF type:complete len:266 (+),score=30.79 TRINITY_DN30965_c0_g1_i1:118-915(+)